MHRQTAARIVGAARLPENAQVLEIGPGTGMLTRELLTEGLRVIAVEADHTLVPELTASFAGEIESQQLRVLNADIRNFDPAIIDGSYHLVANIPYYITGEIIRQFLTAANQPSSMTLLVQKEVAVRIAREKKESLLSLSVKVYGDPSYCFTVPRGAFVPAPNVDSAVLRIANISRTAFANTGSEERFFTLIRAGFAHKRKRLAKNLEVGWSKAAILGAFDAAGLDANTRAEDLTLATWLSLTEHLPLGA